MRKLLLSGTLLAWATPALAIEPGFLMETHFYQWSDWRENLELYDCTRHIWTFILNAPPIVEPPPIEPIVEPPPYVPPPYVAPYTPPVTPVVAVPEASTWLMLLTGLAMMSVAMVRRAHTVRSLA